jgi:hypothetical protein
VNQGLYDRLPNYILQQRHFYPLFPGRVEARIALQESGLGEFVGGTPDILILPSELQYFAKVLPPIPGFVRFVDFTGLGGVLADDRSLTELLSLILDQ